MDPPQVINSDELLFELIDKIVTNQYVLIRNAENKIAGIVTTSDLSLQFRQLAEPFLLLSEIENQIRQIIIRGGFTTDQLKSYCDRKDNRELEKIQSVADLNLGEYLQLLADPQAWRQLRLRLDRTIFIHRLNQVREIRNDIMHFDPDPISEDELNTLRKFTAFLHMCKTGDFDGIPVIGRLQSDVLKDNALLGSAEKSPRRPKRRYRFQQSPGPAEAARVAGEQLRAGRRRLT